MPNIMKTVTFETKKEIKLKRELIHISNGNKVWGYTVTYDGIIIFQTQDEWDARQVFDNLRYIPQ